MPGHRLGRRLLFWLLASGHVIVMVLGTLLFTVPATRARYLWREVEARSVAGAQRNR